jgi:ketosteroid isomerase-like protein
MLKELTEQYIHAFNKKDLAAIEMMLAIDFSLEDPVVKRVEGKKPALDAIARIFAGCNSVTFVAKGIYVDGETSFIEFSLDLDSTHIEGVDVIAWNGVLMKSMRAYLNLPGSEQ